MAERIVSPGVFTNEKDLSFLPQGIDGIGAALIGPTLEGPAFTPTIVRNFAEFEKFFGKLNEDFYVRTFGIQTHDRYGVIETLWRATKAQSQSLNLQQHGFLNSAGLGFSLNPRHQSDSANDQRSR